MNLITIARGWYQYLRSSPEVRVLMEERISVCSICPQREAVAQNGLISKVTDDPNLLYRCGLCKCPLGPLSSLNEPGCKANKWKR